MGIFLINISLVSNPEIRDAYRFSFNGKVNLKLLPLPDSLSTHILPDASGWELAKEIKMLRPGLPIISQTAYAMSIDKEKSKEASCEGYISKPIIKKNFYNYCQPHISPTGAGINSKVFRQKMRKPVT